MNYHRIHLFKTYMCVNGKEALWFELMIEYVYIYFLLFLFSHLARKLRIQLLDGTDSFRYMSACLEQAQEN